MASTLTPPARLREAMVLAIRQLGGSSRRDAVLAKMEVALELEFTDDDLRMAKARPHDAKWKTRATFERDEMVRDGVLVDRNDGVWQLTRPGKPR